MKRRDIIGSFHFIVFSVIVFFKSSFVVVVLGHAYILFFYFIDSFLLLEYTHVFMTKILWFIFHLFRFIFFSPKMEKNANDSLEWKIIGKIYYDKMTHKSIITHYVWWYKLSKGIMKWKTFETVDPVCWRLRFWFYQTYESKNDFLSEVCLHVMCVSQMRIRQFDERKNERKMKARLIKKKNIELKSCWRQHEKSTDTVYF